MTAKLFALCFIAATALTAWALCLLPDSPDDY